MTGSKIAEQIAGHLRFDDGIMIGTRSTLALCLVGVFVGGVLVGHGLTPRRPPARGEAS